MERLEAAITTIEPTHSLKTASVTSLIESLELCQVKSMWLQDEKCFECWRDREEKVKALMISDVEYEVYVPNFAKDSQLGLTMR